MLRYQRVANSSAPPLLPNHDGARRANGIQLDEQPHRHSHPGSAAHAAIVHDGVTARFARSAFTPGQL